MNLVSFQVSLFDFLVFRSSYLDLSKFCFLNMFVGHCVCLFLARLVCTQVLLYSIQVLELFRGKCFQLIENGTTYTNTRVTYKAHIDHLIFANAFAVICFKRAQLHL